MRRGSRVPAAKRRFRAPVPLPTRWGLAQWRRAVPKGRQGTWNKSWNLKVRTQKDNAFDTMRPATRKREGANLSGGWWAVACVLRGSLAYRGPMTARLGDHINSQVSCADCILSRTLCYIQGVRRVRAVASRVALLWIVWQATALVTAPIVIARAASGDALTQQLCECPDAVPGRQCPMHHHSPSAPHPSSSDDASARCSARAPVTPAESALASVSTVVGMVPVRVSVWSEPQFAGVVAVSSGHVFSRSTPPLSPPPKA